MDAVELECFEFDCCFCNKGITSDDVNPCDLSIVTNINKDKDRQKSQWLFCHVGCLKVTIHEEMVKHFAIDDKKNHGKYKEFKLSCKQAQPYEYMCYLCYQGIESDEVNPCAINIMSNIDKEEAERYNQTFYFHANCFKPTLHTYMQGYFVFADD